MIQARSVVLTLLLFGHFSVTASAQTLYGITETPSLIRIDTATGAGTLVGPITGSPGVVPNGLAFRGSKLYTFDLSPLSFGAREIDPLTAAPAPTSINIGLPASGWLIGNLAFRADGMGFLSNGPITSELYRFDITVPNNALLGPLNPPMVGLVVLLSTPVEIFLPRSPTMLLHPPCTELT
jgi:hypothetical protein